MSATPPPAGNASSRVRLPPDAHSQVAAVPANQTSPQASYAPPPALPSPTGYPLQYGLGQPYATSKFNALAIAALVAAFFLPPLGIILGHLSLGQIRRDNDRGYGVGLSATLIAYTLTILGGALFIGAIMIGTAGMLSR